VCDVMIPIWKSSFSVNSYFFRVLLQSTFGIVRRSVKAYKIVAMQRVNSKTWPSIIPSATRKRVKTSRG
jgi:hypothetical protein